MNEKKMEENASKNEERKKKVSEGTNEKDGIHESKSTRNKNSRPVTTALMSKTGFQSSLRMFRQIFPSPSMFG